MIEIIQFDSSNMERLERLGFSLRAISLILLGPSRVQGPPVAAGSPGWARSYIAREFNACENTFNSARLPWADSMHPCSGIPTLLTKTFIPNKFPSMVLPVFRMYGEDEDRFCLAFCDLTSRVTHIIVPKLGCVVFDLDQSRSIAAWEAYEANKEIKLGQSNFEASIAVIDMVTSYAHQAMNFLSGVQRIFDNGLCGFFDEIWINGVEFFGRTENIFPELCDKFRHLSSNQMIANASERSLNLFKVGSNFMTDSLLERLSNLRISKNYKIQEPPRRWPLLAITVRTLDRRCINLPEVVAELVSKLSFEFPDIGVVFDGWVRPEASYSTPGMAALPSDLEIKRIREEADLCERITELLSPNTVVANVVGLSLFESIEYIRNVDIYFSHVGTLQHKISWFSNARGVVHGPKAELSRMESSYYACSNCDIPLFVNENDVLDADSEHSRGPRYADYRIINTAKLIENFRKILSENRAISTSELCKFFANHKSFMWASMKFFKYNN
jgi:hypothetical protein